MKKERNKASFRDPDGFVFNRDSLVYRQLNESCRDDYEMLMNSGLYQALVDAGLLIPHEEVDVEAPEPEKAFKVIQPELIPFISYPYEWCFSQLKDAALTTLKIQKIAFDFGMSLKDCSAYNIQFINGKAVFIDTLSFEKYQEGQPWVAYKQFCQHFLAPLALTAYKDVRLNELLKSYIDGIPLDLASLLLPFRSRFKLSLLMHIHLHAKSQQHYADKTNSKKSSGKVSRFSFLGIIDGLESAVKAMKWRPAGTEWGDYYADTNYSSDAHLHKKQLVGEFLDKVNPDNVWDIGANTGIFSRVASEKGIATVSSDIDPAAVEKNYLECLESKRENILPLLLDLTNPSPGIGWENQERSSFIERGPADTVMALALIHHLAISNNLPFDKVAENFSRICDSLIIEFVPKRDSQVRRLLTTREDIFPDYNEEGFENAFSKYFSIENAEKVKESERTLYLMKKKG